MEKINKNQFDCYISNYSSAIIEFLNKHFFEIQLVVGILGRAWVWREPQHASVLDYADDGWWCVRVSVGFKTDFSFSFLLMSNVVRQDKAADSLNPLDVYTLGRVYKLYTAILHWFRWISSDGVQWRLGSVLSAFYEGVRVALDTSNHFVLLAKPIEEDIVFEFSIKQP